MNLIYISNCSVWVAPIFFKYLTVIKRYWRNSIDLSFFFFFLPSSTALKYCFECHCYLNLARSFTSFIYFRGGKIPKGGQQIWQTNRIYSAKKLYCMFLHCILLVKKWPSSSLRFFCLCKGGYRNVQSNCKKVPMMNKQDVVYGHFVFIMSMLA